VAATAGKAVQGDRAGGNIGALRQGDVSEAEGTLRRSHTEKSRHSSNGGLLEQLDAAEDQKGSEILTYGRAATDDPAWKCEPHRQRRCP
jgi:hypothetical protein